MKTEKTNKALASLGATDPFEAYADAVAPRNIIGTLLKFTKGDYVAGEGNPVEMGTTFTANLDELHVGWVKWVDGRPVEHIMQRVADGAIPPKRNELGDQDPSTWEVDRDGEPRDPWQLTNYLPMMNEQGELFTFTTNSRGGLSTVGELSRRYARHRRRHPDVHPIIALDVNSYQHKKRERGRIKYPVFTPMGWEPKKRFTEALVAAGLVVAEAAPSEPDPADELNDAVAF